MHNKRRGRDREMKKENNLQLGAEGVLGALDWEYGA